MVSHNSARDDHGIETSRKIRGRIRHGARKVGTVSKRLSRNSSRKIKHGTTKVTTYTYRLSAKGAKRTTGALVAIHAHTIKRPHLYMQSNWAWYARWHAWPKHRIIHYVSLSSYLLLVGLMVFSSIKIVLAADLSNNWDFSTPSNYSFDSGVEASGSSARLKAQEYSSDANTAALYHMNEASGSTLDDGSSNNNDAATTGSPSFGSGIMNNGLSLNGTNQSASVPDSASLSVTGQQSAEAWIKPSSTFNNSSSQSQTILDKGSYRLGLDNTNGKAYYEVQNNDGEQWTKRLGDGQSESWDFNHASVESTVAYGSNVYVGLGIARGDGEVWKWNGSTWSKVGGDGLNNSWADQTYESVSSLATNGTALYAGLGTTAGDGEVWTCELSTNCQSWTKIAGDGIGGLLASSYSAITSMSVYGGKLYAGTAGLGHVWRYDGATTWVKVAGDSVNSSWGAGYERVASMYSDGTSLYAGTGDTDGDGELWRYSGSSWTQVGGDGLNGSWNTIYNTVRSITSLNGDLYAGLGDGANEAVVYKYNGSTWVDTNIGLSGNISQVQALTTDGTYIYAARNGLSTATSNTGRVARYNGSAWTIIGGANVNNSWSIAGNVPSLLWANNKLYATSWTTTANNTAMVWEWNGTTWTQIGGSYINNSWGPYGIARVNSTTSLNGKLYYGLGTSTNNAHVYEYDGVTARRIGGAGLYNSWPANTYESVLSLTKFKGELYAGLGSEAGDGEVWKWNGSTWSKVGGDGVNSSWATTYGIGSLIEWRGDLYASQIGSVGASQVWRYNSTSWNRVDSGWTPATYQMFDLVVYDDKLCAGGGGNGSSSNVFCWTGSGSWTHIGGNGVNGGWLGVTNGFVGLSVFDGKLIAGENNNNSNLSIWSWNGSAWTQIGGNGISNSWESGAYSFSGFGTPMVTYNGELYVGTNGAAGSGDIWRLRAGSWQKIGGTGVNNSWQTSQGIEEIKSLITYKGRLYAGLGNSINSDALVYSFGNNAYVESSISSFDSSWHHIAGKYDGGTIRLYIDGILEGEQNYSITGVDNSLALLIGKGHGLNRSNEVSHSFSGMIDEVRISNTARSSFTSKPYAMTPQAVRLSSSVRKSGVESWDGMSSSETTNGGTITYRLSDDEGVTWKYWNGSAWAASSGYSDANSIGDINTNIGTFPVSFGGIAWQAVLSGDGTQQVQLNSVTLAANSDTVAPDSNAANIVAAKSNGGGVLSSNAWTNGSSPYFSWDAGTDAGSGISGYCLYLGQTGSSDPETTKGILGTSPLNTNGRCQFAVSSTNFDAATAGYLGTALTSSNNPYYLNVKAIDRAGNIFDTSEQFQFRFDNTAPNNPGFISAPSGFINTKSATITWPIVGGQAASDINSGLLGLQYRFNDGPWYGDDHIGTGDSSDLLANDGTYVTTDPNPPDSDDIDDGINTIYIRTWDQAGNVSSTYTTAALKVNTSGAPTEPQNVVATPSTNTANSFAFSWAAPQTFVGSANNITYCYTINTLPNVSNCSFTTAGDTDLAAGPYATQPGANTFYVVAKDESNNINYSSFSSVTFTANTPAPSLPLNMDIVDVSIKTTSNWRLAITWDEPAVVGAGISAYRVYRSTDNTNFNLVGSSSSPSFVDTGLSQQTYYYKVRACDSANNCSADSAVVDLLPTGKFTTPAILTSEPVSSDLTTKRAKITWSTDRSSDSKISIGTASGEYSPSEVGNSSQVTSHVIDLDNLAAGTTYYYVAKWTDVDGNTGTSQEYTFTTAPAPVLKEVNTLSINLSSTTLQFTVKDATKVELMYGKNDSFGGVKSINTSRNESTYELEISGLDDGVKYLYRITMYDSEGGKYQSSIFSFTTPPRPKIANLRFQPLEGEPTSTQKVTWDTNIPTNSIVSYGKVTTTGTLTQTQELKTAHEIIIRGLEDNSEYFLIAQGRDNNGNIAVSDKQVFKTALDTRPPLVSDIVIEPTIRGTGAEARGQIVVSWKTDEPSTSQVAFAEGSSAQVFNNRTAEDAQLTTEHLVIISDLAPSKVYSIKPISRDKSGNASAATSQSAIVGRASDSVLNIVLNTLRKVFGL